MKDKLLIWDIDGTLIDCMGSGRRAMDKTFEKLYKINNGFKEVSMHGRLDWQIVRDAIRANGLHKEDIVSFLDEYGRVLNEEIKASHCGIVLPGIKEILDETQNNPKIYHALGTGNCEKGARLKLLHLGLDTYFDIGGFGDEDLERWEVIDKLIKKAKDFYNTKFLDRDIYVIGDTPMDIECGKKLSINSVAVATGGHYYEDLLKCSPDFIFHNFEDFGNFINIITK